ncbi:Major facilitator superfamily domain general substrate transporter [Penicillium vulpinum]|uniref:Major facilitator superfamily domain general substrate transporter n=1 Tax=Penicillium vulpinum TaxID=29845 RepID=UPI002547FB6F|nr:Major facilitator superfamily domain general substrate transporter [Penicillium vulpinum]KAJ5971172.1 Major facilitator superfamily domain general substrate transporter [Penicillium vulpinum]
MSTFNGETQGTDVTKAFPDRVKGKTCTTITPTDQVYKLTPATTVLICGLKRGDLAATTADALAHGGAGTIIYTGRSQSELQPVVDHINRKYKMVKMIFVTADVGSLASVREAANNIRKLGMTIDGFVGFPEVMAVPWTLTEDGLESHFQRNYLCYFLTLNLLCDVMGLGSRVVLVTSSLRNEAPAPSWDDLEFENGENYNCLDGYSKSMLAIILFIKSLAKKYSDRSIAAFSANPGNTKTNIQTYVAMEEIKSWLQRKKELGEDIPVLLQQAPKSLGQGSATVLRGLLDPDLEGKIIR